MKLLFIPGSGSGRALWAHQLRHFAGSEAILLPGHPEGKPCTSIDDYVECLRSYIQRQRYQDVVLVGHSMGGAIAQLYGLKYGSEIKALVLMGTGARLRVSPARLEQLKGSINDKAAWREYLEGEYSQFGPEVGRAIIEEGMRIGPAVALNDYLCCDKFDIMDRVQAVKLPTLLICGSADDRTPLKYTRYLSDKIEGAAMVVIEGAGHLLHLEKPEEVNQAIETFLAGLA